MRLLGAAGSSCTLACSSLGSHTALLLVCTAGQLCLAIGNPFGFSLTLTTGAWLDCGRCVRRLLNRPGLLGDRLTHPTACPALPPARPGVISGLNRDIRSQLGSTIPGGIQTDAAINPGGLTLHVNQGPDGLMGFLFTSIFCCKCNQFVVLTMSCCGRLKPIASHAIL